MWDAPSDSRLLDQHCGHQTLHTHPPTPPPRPRQPPGMPDLHSLGCCRVGPGGRGAHHGGDGEALLQSGKDPPAPRGQCCGGRANIASDKRRGRLHPRPARAGPPAPLLPCCPSGPPQSGGWRRRGGGGRSARGSLRAAPSPRHRQRALGAAILPSRPVRRRNGSPRNSLPAAEEKRSGDRRARALQRCPPYRRPPRPRRPGPPFRGCAGPRSRRVPAARGEVIHCRRLVKSL